MIPQLQKLVDVIQLNESDITRKIKAEVVRYNRFTKSLFGKKVAFAGAEVDAKSYVKFLLKEGSVEEKREIISCFNSKIILMQKTVSLN